MHAYEKSVLWINHGWSSAVGFAADLQIAAALPVARWVELAIDTGNGYRTHTQPSSSPQQLRSTARRSCCVWTSLVTLDDWMS